VASQQGYVLTDEDCCLVFVPEVPDFFLGFDEG
jgi:hypothetical protein